MRPIHPRRKNTKKEPKEILIKLNFTSNDKKTGKPTNN